MIPSTIYDPNGVKISVGSLVKCGEGQLGEVVALIEPDESYGKVRVKWPEFDDPENFTYHGTGYCWEGPDVCQDVEVMVP